MSPLPRLAELTAARTIARIEFTKFTKFTKFTARQIFTVAPQAKGEKC